MKKKSETVWLSEAVVKYIEMDLQKWYPNETGGVLIGYWSDYQAVVTQAIDGGPKAIRTKTSFLPDQVYHEEQIAKVYLLSGRTEYYLGDWHTHPNAAAYLSDRDKKTLKQIALYKPARSPNPLMLVYGTNPVKFKIWLLRGLSIFRRTLLNQCAVILFR